jgi:hypothetical protein
MKTLLASLVFFLAPCLIPQLEANSLLPPCVAGSLLSYQSSSGCVLGGGAGGVLIFSGFTFSVTNSDPGGNPVLDASQIELTPDPIGIGGGFIFSGFQNAPVVAGQNVTYNIDYFFLIDPGPVLTGDDLEMDPPFGNVVITQSICADSFFASPTDCESNGVQGVSDSAPQTLSVDDTNPPASFSAHLNLNPPVLNFANVETAFVLTGGTTGAGFDALTSTSTVVSTPEPETALLGLMGLIAIGIFRCYRNIG